MAKSLFRRVQEGFFGYIDSAGRDLLGAAVLALNFTQSNAQTLQNMTNGTNTASLAPTAVPTPSLPPTLSEGDHIGNIVMLSIIAAPFACFGLAVLCCTRSNRRSNDNSNYFAMGVAADSCCDALFRNDGP